MSLTTGCPYIFFTAEEADEGSSRAGCDSLLDADQ